MFLTSSDAVDDKNIPGQPELFQEQLLIPADNAFLNDRAVREYSGFGNEVMLGFMEFLFDYIA